MKLISIIHAIHVLTLINHIKSSSNNLLYKLKRVKDSNDHEYKLFHK